MDTNSLLQEIQRKQQFDRSISDAVGGNVRRPMPVQQQMPMRQPLPVRPNIPMQPMTPPLNQPSQPMMPMRPPMIQNRPMAPMPAQQNPLQRFGNMMGNEMHQFGGAIGGAMTGIGNMIRRPMMPGGAMGGGVGPVPTHEIMRRRLQREGVAK